MAAAIAAPALAVPLGAGCEHDVHDFVKRTAGELQAEYERIQRHAASDPGTAGDQGEENWAKLLREWLPPSFHVVTKGRIVSQSGALSPQVDVLVLLPTYPSILRNNKHYLAGGVAAAFECKVTLKAKHVKDSVDTACKLGRMNPRRIGTPLSELCPQIIFGLLAHSHSWKAPTSTPIETVTDTLWEADAELVQHQASPLILSVSPTSLPGIARSSSNHHGCRLAKMTITSHQ